MEVLSLDVSQLSKMFWLATLSFGLAFLWTPFLTHLLYKYGLRQSIKSENTPVYHELHQQKGRTPTMGGILIWVTVFVVTMLLNLSRSQTYLPLFALISVGILGLADDFLNVKKTSPAMGMRSRYKLVWQIVIAIIGAWWFFDKLGWNSIHIPAVGDFTIGWWYIPLFVFVIVATTNAVNITDGLDGLAGGLLGIAYFAFGGIAFVQGNFGIAAFCGTVGGAILAFLWFNIYPARFFMGDTGSMALGATLGVIAMLTNSVLVLPFIGFIFMVETLSVIIQVIYRKCTHGKKLLLSAPLHHHLEAKGWPETKVTMRFWVLGAVMAGIGFLIALIGRGNFHGF